MIAEILLKEIKLYKRKNKSRIIFQPYLIKCRGQSLSRFTLILTTDQKKKKKDFNYKVPKY